MIDGGWLRETPNAAFNEPDRHTELKAASLNASPAATPLSNSGVMALSVESGGIRQQRKKRKGYRPMSTVQQRGGHAMERKARTTRPNADTSTLGAEELLKLSEAQTNAIIDMQKRFLGACEEMGRAWLARVKSETELWSDLANEIQEARSIPDALSAYQQGMARRLQMAVDDGRRLAEDSQHLVSVMTGAGEKTGRSSTTSTTGPTP
jgi:hypothetical protein